MKRKPFPTKVYDKSRIYPRDDDDSLPDISRADVAELTSRARASAVNLFSDSDERYLLPSLR